MRHFILTSTNFTGQVEYKFSDDSYLISFKYEANMTDQQRVQLLKLMPLTVRGFEDLVAAGKTLKVEEVQQSLDFDAFWNAYDKKINRKRCQPLWDKLSNADKLRCLHSIPPYKRYLHRTNFRAQKDPDGYLRDRLFETEWKKLN
jgi:hypothetical protein